MPDAYGTFGSYLNDALGNARTFARQQATDQAIQAFASNPNDQAAYGKLLTFAPDIAQQATSAQLAKRKLDAADAQSAREQATNDAVAGALGYRPPSTSPTSLHAQQAPTGNAGAATTPPAGIPPSPAGGDEIVVTGGQPKPTIGDIAHLGGLDAAHKFLGIQTALGGLDKQSRDAADAKAESLAQTVPVLQNVPYAQRRDSIDANRAFYKAHGWSDAEIDAFDPTDDNLKMAVSHAVSYKDFVGQQDKDRTFAETVRSHNDENARAAASRAVSVRGQNMSDARSREANRTAQAQATNLQVVDYLADNFLATGGQLPNLGFRSGPLRTAVIARAQQKASAAGQSGSDLAGAAAAFVGQKAGAKTVGNIGARADFGVNEMNASAPLALAASAAVPRGDFVPFNKVQQIVSRGGGSPELKDFAVKTQAMINAYNLTAQRAGSSVGEREHNATLLATADSPAAYRAAINAMRQEGAVAKTASKQSAADVSGKSAGVPSDIAAILKKYGH